MDPENLGAILLFILLIIVTIIITTAIVTSVMQPTTIEEPIHIGCVHNFQITTTYEPLINQYRIISECYKCGLQI